MKPLSIRPSRIQKASIKPISYIIGVLIWVISPLSISAQDGAWVFYRDKPDTSFHPKEYFNQAGYERRQTRNIPIGDFYDRPVSGEYIAQVASYSDTVYYNSRWLNASAIAAPSSQLEHIARLPFVKTVLPRKTGKPKPLSYAEKPASGFSISWADSLLLRFQLKRMKGHVFARQQLDGSGITVAIFDVGFKKADEHPAFAHLFEREAIKAVYDFVGDDENVYNIGSHGTAVLGAIAGRFDTIPMGLAQGADFLLARTERMLHEPISEEYNWIAAAEWADKHGADIISSSLGYSESRYFQEQMDGQTAPVARAANVAASKGILVINAAGNEGINNWSTIVAPADADSVLTVGGIDPLEDVAINFTSRGPAADGTPKPNISNLGRVYSASPRKYQVIEGTSFSAPLSAGFAACLWQSNPTWSNMEVFSKMEKAGHLYPYYDYLHGYGIPQADKALGQDEAVEPTFELEVTTDYVNVKIDTSFIPDQDEAGEFLERPKNLYYKIENAKGNIERYGVVLAESEESHYFEREELTGKEIITVHFEGYTEKLNLQSQ